jgi:hypothetical protein
MFQDELDESYYAQERTEEIQVRSVRLNALCRVYEQADRVLTGDPVVVNVANDGPAPAWSDGASITINASQIGDMDLESLTQVNGLNYHELAHHLYTPRRGTDLVKWVIENNYMQTFNMLEDQRIETLLVARYPSIAPYLTATCARWLAASPDEMQSNYVLMRGRRYLPVELRQAFRDMFNNKELIPAIIDIVDQYRLLAFPKDYAKARELIKRFNDEVLPNMPKIPQGGNGCTNRDPVTKGRPEPGKAQERDAQRANGMGKAESEWTPRKSIEEQTEDAPNTNPTENITQVMSTEEQLEARQQSQQSNTAGLAAGDGHIASAGGLPNNINDMLDNVIQSVLERKDVQQDVKIKQKVIIGGDGKHEDTLRTGKFDKTPVPSEAMANFRKFAKELERLRDECEPMWHREEASGRLNVQRALRGCEIDEAFDRWDEGNDGADIEAVIMVDRSGSMNSGKNDMHASIASWTIKRALESIGAPVTVYAFDDQAELAYARTELASKTQYKFIYGNGGTNPYSTLLAAEQLLMSSRKKNKMLFMITDGAFDARRNDEIIARIQKRGVLTAMTLIMQESDLEYYTERGTKLEEFRHGMEIFARINSARDLVPFAKSVVAGAIKKRGR